MDGNRCRALGAVLLVLLVSMAAEGRDATDGDYEKTLERALVLLPRRPAKLVLVNRKDLPGGNTGPLSHAEGFVTHGDPTVYLVRQGDTLQHALAGKGIFDYALAVVIWHEMAHVQGLTEQEAQREEETLWKQYIAAGRVDPDRGRRYLALLTERH
jgi:hypothetical protein